MRSSSVGDRNRKMNGCVRNGEEATVESDGEDCGVRDSCLAGQVVG